MGGEAEAEVGEPVAEIEAARGVPVGSEDAAAAEKFQDSQFVVVVTEGLLLETQSAEVVERVGADRESQLAAERDLLEEKWVAESSDSELKSQGIDTPADPVPSETFRE